MQRWAGFYKTGASNVHEAISQMGWGNYRSTSEKYPFYEAFRSGRMQDNHLFASMSINNYLVVVDYEYSLIANESREINSLAREKELTRKFQVGESLKMYYENNLNIQAFAIGRNGILEQFVYESDDLRQSYEISKLRPNDSGEDEYQFESNNPFIDVCDAIRKHHVKSIWN